jgi:hypothetical protein
MYVHPTYAVSTQRVPLGVLDAWMWARQPKTGKGKCAGVRESLRWVEGYQRLAELAAKLPGTRLVYVADREADIMELWRRRETAARRWIGCCAASTTGRWSKATSCGTA